MIDVYEEASAIAIAIICQRGIVMKAIRDGAPVPALENDLANVFGECVEKARQVKCACRIVEEGIPGHQNRWIEEEEEEEEEQEETAEVPSGEVEETLGSVLAYARS